MAGGLEVARHEPRRAQDPDADRAADDHREPEAEPEQAPEMAGRRGSARRCASHAVESYREASPQNRLTRLFESYDPGATRPFRKEIAMHELAQIQDRLRTMEARQRRLRAWCACSTALWIVSCLAAVAKPSSEELRTKRLVLLDAQGAECGTLGTVEDGAALTLKSRDAKACVMLAASTANWVEQTGARGFTISSDGKTTDRRCCNGKDRGRPDRLRAARRGRRVATVSAKSEISIRRVGIDRADERHASAARPMASSEQLRAAAVCAWGEAPCSAVNLIAGKQGCWIGGSWNDQDDFDLWTDGDGPRISLSEPTDDQDDDAPAELELRAADHAGSIELRKDGKTAFRVPQ
jgi:hypothetical protein